MQPPAIQSSSILNQTPIQAKLYLQVNTSIKRKVNQEAKFPLGFDNFYKMVTSSNVFVDKSLLIKTIIDRTYQAMLITRPRRWGKTLNMSMLYYFLNKTVDQNGKAQQINPNRVLFQEGEFEDARVSFEKKYLKKLKIAEEKNGAYLNHQGKYPTIFITFKNIKPENLLQAKKKIGKTIENIFDQHAYLKDKEYKKWQQVLQLIGDLSCQKQKLQSVDLTEILLDICEMLFKHHRKRIYVLIDQYDQPFNYMLERDLDERQKVAQLITNMLGACGKGNEYLQKIIMTGVFDTLVKQGGLGFNNFKCFSIINKELSQFYGFSQKQIQNELISKMFKARQQHLSQQSQLILMISSWYNGYVINGIKKLYNPYSVILYLNQCLQNQQIVQGKCFWAYSGSDILLKKIFQAGIKDNLLSSFFALDSHIQEQEPSKVILAYQFQTKLDRIDFHNNKQTSEKILTYLLANSGYITCTVSRQKKVQAIIPNRQIAIVFRNVFLQWMKKTLNISYSEINIEKLSDLKQKLVQAFERLKSSLSLKNQKIFNNIISIRYMISNNQTHIVSAEAYSGSGYIDNIFYPREQKKTETAIIHQYKYTENSQYQQQLYQDALWQIFEKNYLSHPLTESKINKKIQKILVRPIVIVYSSLTQSINLYTKEDTIYNLEQARKISLFFSQVQQIIKQQQTDKKQARMRLLELFRIKNIKQLLDGIFKIQQPAEYIIKRLKQIKIEQQHDGILQAQNFDYKGVIKQIKKKKKKTVDSPKNVDNYQKVKFYLGFQDGESLYHCDQKDLQQIQGISSQQALKWHKQINKMKQNRKYFKNSGKNTSPQ